MSTTALRITTYAPAQVGAISRIKLVSQAVTGPPGADGEGAPNSATYVTLSTNATLTGERVLTAGTGITLTDAGAGDTLTVDTTAVLPTLADAKGDLLVASAADTITRLAVGTNDYVLTADSAQATGVKWAAAAGGVPSPDSPPSLNGGTTRLGSLPGVVMVAAPVASPTLGGGSDTAYHYFPIWVAADITIDALQMNVWVGGSGAAVRLGLYAANGYWQPTALVVDAGSVSAATGGVKTASFANVSVPAGRYLMCAQPNGVAAFTPLTFQGALIGGYGVNQNAQLLILRQKTGNASVGALVDPAYTTSMAYTDSTLATYYQMWLRTV